MNWKLLKKHQFNVVPDADEQELKELEQSIVENGYDPKFPIWVYQGPQDSEPKIIDGAQRHGICVKNEVEPLVREFVGTNLDAIQFILKSIKRRNLNAGQRAAVFNELSTQMQAELKFEAEQRMKQGVPSDINVQGSTTAQIMSDQAGVGEQTWKQVKRIEKYSPELYDAVKQGKISASSAARQVQEKTASEDRRIEMQAKKIIMDRINDAVQLYGPTFMDRVVSDLKESGRSDIKFKIIIDDN